MSTHKDAPEAAPAPKTAAKAVEKSTHEDVQNAVGAAIKAAGRTEAPTFITNAEVPSRGTVHWPDGRTDMIYDLEHDTAASLVTNHVEPYLARLAG